MECWKDRDLGVSLPYYTLLALGTFSFKIPVFSKSTLALFAHASSPFPLFLTATGLHSCPDSGRTYTFCSQQSTTNPGIRALGLDPLLNLYLKDHRTTAFLQTNLTQS